MYEKVKDFAAEWRIESEKTAQLLEALTDESLSQRVAEGRWTLGEIAWHLVQSLHYMTYMGLSFPAPPSEEPASAAKIAEVYRKISGELLHVVMTQWNDAALLESREVAGEPWQNGASLRFTVMHQAHHRGQMTVLMRQAGLADVPKMYG